MHRRWCTVGDAPQVMHCRWCIEGEPLQVLHCRWCTAGDAPQVMHRKWCTEIQDQSDIWYDTSDLCIGSVGFGVSNCSGVLVVSPSNSKSRTDYWVLFVTLSMRPGGRCLRTDRIFYDLIVVLSLDFIFIFICFIFVIIWYHICEDQSSNAGPLKAALSQGA